MKKVVQSDSLLLKLNIFLISTVIFLLPFNLKIIAPAIALFALSSIVLIIKEKLSFRINRSHALLLALYFFLILGVLWSNNLSAAVFDLEVKMSLFIFPILLSFIRYNAQQLNFLKKVFVLSLIVASGTLLYFAIGYYRQSGAVDDLFYINLSPKVHPSYLSFYVVIGISFLLVWLRENYFSDKVHKVIAVLVAVYFFIFNILLLSKIGVLASILIVLYFVIQQMYKTKKIGLGTLVLVGLFFTIYLSFQKSPYIKQRVKEFTIGLTANEGKANSGSTGVRLKIWSNAIQLIKENPIFGYGTGDVKDVLVKSYKKSGYFGAYEKKLNAHNQFIQVTIALGILGLILFLSIFGFYIYESFVNGNSMGGIFIVISIIFMLPESILENQAGTVFFGLLFALLNQKPLRKT